MLLVFGLGNPGAQYERTRHNVGFLAVTSCAAFFQRTLRKRCFRPYRTTRIDRRARLVLPLTYMNRSGTILSYFQRPLSVVVCDQMDLPPGTIRIRKSGSSAGHRGLSSIIEHKGDGEFVRIYIGIGRPLAGVAVTDHVLGVIDEPLIEEGIALASEALVALIQGSSVEEVARAYNGKRAAERP